MRLLTFADVQDIINDQDNHHNDQHYHHNDQHAHHYQHDDHDDHDHQLSECGSDEKGGGKS